MGTWKLLFQNRKQLLENYKERTVVKKKQVYAALLSLAVLCAGCSMAKTEETTNNTANSSLVTIDYTSLFSNRDYEIGYEEESAGHITFTGTSAESDSSAVTVDNGVVTIGAEGTYILSGTLDSGMVVVNVSDTEKVQLVLDGVTITSPTSAAIYIPSADKVFITTAENSVNVLKNGGSYENIDDNNIDGVIFAKSDITLNGTGTLQISADVEHGVVSKDSLTITSGTYEISVAGHGLSGKDSVAIADGSFTLTTGKDGIQSDNQEDTEKGYIYLKGGSYTMNCQGDGVSASNFLTVDGGTYEIVTGGGSANGEVHTNTMEMPTGMGGGMKGPMGNQQPPQLTEGSETMTPPEWMEPPEGATGDGMTPPEGMQPPEGDQAMTPPENMQQQPQTDTTTTQSSTETTTDDTTPSTKGLKAGTDLIVTGGTFTLDCADDGFHSNGNVAYHDGTAQISSGGKAFHGDKSVVIENGTINIETCFEGLEAQNVTINGGVIDLFATDDAINAASDTVSNKDDISITITGGTITMDAGGDGLDSNGNISISGGTVFVSSAAQGADTPLDYDGTATITGGMLLGTGVDGMVQNFSTESTQCAVLLSVEVQPAESVISICDEQGNTLLTYNAAKQFSSLLFSCPDLAMGNTYTVTAGTFQTEITLEEVITGTSTMMHEQPGTNGTRGERPTKN